MAYHNEGTRLRALASNPHVHITWREHALDEMAKDKIGKIDVINMLKRCSVVRVELHGFEERWNADGFDGDGNRITVVVVAYEDQIRIKVVTAWARG